MSQGGAKACADRPDPENFDFYLVAETINGNICDLDSFDDRLNTEDAVEKVIAAIANPNGNALIGLVSHQQPRRRREQA